MTDTSGRPVGPQPEVHTRSPLLQNLNVDHDAHNLSWPQTATPTSTSIPSEPDDIALNTKTRRPVIKSLIVNASATAVLQGASGVMAFILAVLLARFLGSTGYGRYALAFAWASLLTTPAVLGLDLFLVRGIAVYEVQEKWSLMKGLLLRTNQLVLLTSGLIASCGAAIAILWMSPAFRGSFCVAMLLIPLTALTLLRQGAMQAFNRVISGQLPEYLIRPLLVILSVIALEFVGNGALTPTTALAANVMGVAVAFTIGAVLLRRALPATIRYVQPDFITRNWLRASLPMMLISGVWMANNYAATLVVGTVRGPSAAGVYSAVQKGAEAIVLILTATNMALAPTVARLHARSDPEGLEHAIEHMARLTLFVSAPIALMFIIFPDIYLDLFGPAFQSGKTALVIIAVGQLINAAAGPAGSVLMMTGQERVAVWGVAVGLLANVALAFALVPFLGVTGGAIAFTSSLVLWNTILVILARRLVCINVTAFNFLSLQSRKR
jgi:O-antigen/teichoic acid export membrane protein